MFEAKFGKWSVGLLGLLILAAVLWFVWVKIPGKQAKNNNSIQNANVPTANVSSGNSNTTSANNVNAAYHEDISGCVGASNYTYSFYLELRSSSVVDINALLDQAGAIQTRVINERSAVFSFPDGRICEGLRWLRLQPDVVTADTEPYMPSSVGSNP